MGEENGVGFFKRSKRVGEKRVERKEKPTEQQACFLQEHTTSKGPANSSSAQCQGKAPLERHTYY